VCEPDQWSPARGGGAAPGRGIAVVCSMLEDQASCRAVSENATIFVR
jgi:hypothetical protein